MAGRGAREAWFCLRVKMVPCKASQCLFSSAVGSRPTTRSAPLWCVWVCVGVGGKVCVCVWGVCVCVWGGGGGGGVIVLSS